MVSRAAEVPHRNKRRPAHGFTLVELLVAIAILAAMGVMAWRVMDTIYTTQSSNRQRLDDVQALQTGLAQWGDDLDAVVQMGAFPSLEWTGRMLRMTRTVRGDSAAGVVVVAWTLQNLAQGKRWMRWQSEPVRSKGNLDIAWQRAGAWANGESNTQGATEATLGAVTRWQIYYFRNDAWSNPLSSGDKSTLDTVQSGLSVPEGMRLILFFPPEVALTGPLTRDWVRPTLGGAKP